MDYDVPPGVDGTTYQPGSPAYIWVTENYTPEQWNAIPRDTRQVLISHANIASNATTSPGVQPVNTAYQDGGWYSGAQHMAGRPDKAPMDTILGGLADYHALPVELRGLPGLFGADNSRPHPTAIELDHRGRARDERNAKVQEWMGSPPIQQHPDIGNPAPLVTQPAPNLGAVANVARQIGGLFGGSPTYNPTPKPKATFGQLVNRFMKP
jgi:hypothetical protein